MAALACMAPVRRQPAGSHGPHTPRSAICSSSTPCIGASAAGQVALGVLRTTTAPAAWPSVLPARPVLKLQMPSRAFRPMRRSDRPSARVPESSVTVRSPKLRSMTTSALKVGELCTIRCPPRRRSPPQPKPGCARLSSGATSSGSSRASASSRAGARPGSAADQAMRLQFSAAPSSSARPASAFRRNGPSAHSSSRPNSARFSQGGAAAASPRSSQRLHLAAPAFQARTRSAPMRAACQVQPGQRALGGRAGGCVLQRLHPLRRQRLRLGLAAPAYAPQRALELQLQQLGRRCAMRQLVELDLRVQRRVAVRCPASSAPRRASAPARRAARRWRRACPGCSAPASGRRRGPRH